MAIAPTTTIAIAPTFARSPMDLCQAEAYSRRKETCGRSIVVQTRSHIVSEEIMAFNPAESSSATMFKKNWQRYQTVMANNLMYHKEVYGELHRILTEEAPQPFRFLDIACGDSSSTVECLRGMAVASYHGIDLSQPALDLARTNLETLDCPFKLENRDFLDALRNFSGSVDVVWIGQSLHHLLLPEKRVLMRKVRDILGERGLFLIWEPVRLEGETEVGWYDRFFASRPQWSVLSDDDFADIDHHHRTSDHPETDQTWRLLGSEAGFSRVDEIFRASNNLARVYQYRQ
jgi:SAM-dependent methyltransferase